MSKRADREPPTASPSAKAEASSGAALELGYVRAVHGVDGTLKLRLHDPDSRALHEGVELRFLARGGGAEKLRARVEAIVGEQKDGVLIRVAGVRDREAAEALKSHGAWIARADLPALGEDEYYLADTIGAAVEHVDGHALGVVEGISSNGPQDLFELLWRDARGKKHRYLVPAVPGIVVDFTGGRLRLDPPLGMLPEALEAEFAETEGGVA